MLRSNLSSRPFYNVRLVRSVLAVALGVVVLVTAVNVIRIVTLSSSQATLGARAAEDEAEAERLAVEAAQIRGQINPAEIASVTAAAREANGIIERRAFSWSRLFGEFERTLPFDARITVVQPRVEDDGRLVMVIGVQGRTVADIDLFIEALEAEGTFTEVLAVEEQATEDDLVQAVVEATYVTPPLPTAGEDVS
jgi:hypothetical protein